MGELLSVRCCFFFQAEDGIRDYKVTGVQTCALPIYGWLARFPMWDWVGGRTSIMSAVGLVPMALEGFDIDNFLSGAAAMDERTRANDFRQNAAMLLALMWFYAGNGRG